MENDPNNAAQTTDHKAIEKSRKVKLTRQRRQQREQIMRDCGLVKVRGSVSGKIYWE